MTDMSEMVERVARAIIKAAGEVDLIDSVVYVQSGRHERTPEGGVAEVMRPIFHINAEAAMTLARAAIAAMREPTKEMIYDGNTGIDDAIDFYNYESGAGYSVEPHAARDCWQRMISAALTTTEGR